MKHKFKMIAGCLCDGPLEGELFIPSSATYVTAECAWCHIVYGLDYDSAKMWIVDAGKPTFKGWKLTGKLNAHYLISEALKLLRWN